MRANVSRLRHQTGAFSLQQDFKAPFHLRNPILDSKQNKLSNLEGLTDEPKLGQHEFEFTPRE